MVGVRHESGRIATLLRTQSHAAMNAGSDDPWAHGSCYACMLRAAALHALLQADPIPTSPSQWSPRKMLVASACQALALWIPAV